MADRSTLRLTHIIPPTIGVFDMSHSVTDSTVLLGHGSGGQMMKRIIDEVFLDAFGSPELLAGNDAGVAALPQAGESPCRPTALW